MFDLWRKWFLQICQKLQSLVQKTQEILGINLIHLESPRYINKYISIV